MVSRCPDPGLFHHSSHHRAVTHAVLPPVNSTGLCRHEGPGIRGLLRIHVAQSASLVGTCHGFARIHAYGQGVLSQGLQNTARTELDHWRLSAAGYAAVELHGLSAALGSAVVLGHSVGANIISSIPFVGAHLRFYLLAGHTVNANALLRFYVLHTMMLPLLAIVLIAVHLWRLHEEGGMYDLGKNGTPIVPEHSPLAMADAPIRLEQERTLSYRELLFREIIGIEAL